MENVKKEKNYCNKFAIIAIPLHQYKFATCLACTLYRGIITREQITLFFTDRELIKMNGISSSE